jgi:hypothetical protein
MVGRHCAGCGTWHSELDYQEHGGVWKGYCSNCGELIKP